MVGSENPPYLLRCFPLLICLILAAFLFAETLRVNNRSACIGQYDLEARPTSANCFICDVKLQWTARTNNFTRKGNIVRRNKLLLLVRVVNKRMCSQIMRYLEHFYIFFIVRCHIEWACVFIASINPFLQTFTCKNLNGKMQLD